MTTSDLAEVFAEAAKDNPEQEVFLNVRGCLYSIDIVGTGGPDAKDQVEIMADELIAVWNYGTKRFNRVTVHED